MENNPSEHSNVESELLKDIESKRNTGQFSYTDLETDEKVLARVTDGIYRFPGSAIRELISNAYDADAENVIIETDVPRFDYMTIRDDGNGMSIGALVNMLRHIGGSAKRNDKGSSLQVTDEHDPTRSLKKKRKLIGKIGIGLFSVAQLTREFEIITKQAGENFYLKARIQLHNYSEEAINNRKSDISERGASFEAGKVVIWTEPTDNIEAHGTDIVLKNIKKSAKDQLKSTDVWGQESVKPDASTDTPDYVSIYAEGFLSSNELQVPDFHVGNSLGESGSEFYEESTGRIPCLPWDLTDPAQIKLSKLYQGVLDLTKKTVNPKLSVVLDNYLQMIWTLSLSIPLDYIEKHPFNHSLSDIPNAFAISNSSKGKVVDLELETTERFGEALGLKTNTDDIDFNVVVDGIKLYRPIKFTNLPKSNAVVTDPLLFIGSYQPDFKDMDPVETGGDLDFDAYILWSPKVIPKDHNGVLIRLHNASGIMFDETFMKYQIAEHVIKGQLTVEIFVNKGLDSALNIDRESFNFSHPHYQIVTKWLHLALKQVINKYKAIKKKAREERFHSKKDGYVSKIAQITSASFEKRGYDFEEAKPFLVESEDVATAEIDIAPFDAYRISKDRFEEATGGKLRQTSSYNEVQIKSEAILRILDSYGLLEGLSTNKQAALIEDLLKIISFKG